MTLAFLALLGAPYIYDISSLRINETWIFWTDFRNIPKCSCRNTSTIMGIDPMMTRFRGNTQIDVTTYYNAYSCVANNSERLAQMKVSLPLCIKDCRDFRSGKETPHWRTAYLSSFTVWRNKLFVFFLIFTTKVQLFSAVFEVYARNILLIASFRAEIAKRWSLKTFLELWVVVHVSSNFFHFFWEIE